MHTQNRERSYEETTVGRKNNWIQNSEIVKTLFSLESDAFTVYTS